MASVSLFRKGYGLMFLSMGVLVLLAGTFFVVNGNFNPGVGAHRQTAFIGRLKADPKHVLPCNMSAKADYVLQSATSSANCVPVFANKSQADSFVGRDVNANGQEVNGRFFITDFTLRALPSMSPSPIIHRPSPIPDSGTWTGPATRNPY